MSDVFISYAREEQGFVGRLHAALAANKRETWVDWEKIPPTADWWQEICLGIENADNFIFVLSPHSVQSRVCKEELEHAVLHKKRLIPIVHSQVSRDQIPEVLRSINWIYFQDADDFDKSLQTLIGAIDIDLEWIKTHTNYVTKSTEWARKNRNISLLLRGSELENAEKWFAESARHTIQPTELIAEYLIQSRKNAVRVRRRIVFIGIVTTIVLIVVGTLAYSNYRNFVSEESQKATALAEREIAEEAAQESDLLKATAQADAVEQETIAKARELASQAINILNTPYDSDVDPVLGLLLAAESLHRYTTLEGDQAIRRGLTQIPYTVQMIDHLDIVSSVSFSPDGQFLATASKNGEIRVLDIPGNREVFRKENGNTDGAVAFSPDGNYLAYARNGGGVEILNASDGGRVVILNIPDDSEMRQFNFIGEVRSLEFSPDNRFLVAEIPGDSCGFSYLVIWEINSNTFVTEIRSSGWNTPFDISTDGKWIAVADNECEINSSDISIWDIESESVVGNIEVALNINDLEISPDKQWLAVGTSNPLRREGNLDIFKLEPFSPIFTVIRPTFTQAYWNGVQNVSFSSDGARLVISNDVYLAPSEDFYQYSTLQVWDFDSGTGSVSKLISRIFLDEDINDLTIAPDNQWIAAGIGWGSEAIRKSIVWLIPPYQSGGNQILKYKNQFIPVDRTEIGLMAINSAGDRLGAISRRNFLEWGLPDGQKITDTSIDSEMITFGTSPDGGWIAAKMDEEGMKVFDVFSTNTFLQFANDENLTSAGISLNGKWLAVGSNSNRIVQVWNIESREEITRFETMDLLEKLTISPDGTKVAVQETETLVSIWEVTTGHELHNIKLDQPLNEIVFSWDSEKIAIASGYFEFVSGQNFTNHSDHVQIWDVLSGDELIRIPHQETIYSIAFSPDGKLLFSQTGRLFVEVGNIWSWMIEPIDLVHQACLNANRTMTLEEWNTYFSTEEYHPVCSETN